MANVQNLMGQGPLVLEAAFSNLEEKDRRPFLSSVFNEARARGNPLKASEALWWLYFYAESKDEKTSVLRSILTRVEELEDLDRAFSHIEMVWDKAAFNPELRCSALKRALLCSKKMKSAEKAIGVLEWAWTRVEEGSKEENYIYAKILRRAPGLAPKEVINKADWVWGEARAFPAMRERALYLIVETCPRLGLEDSSWALMSVLNRAGKESPSRQAAIEMQEQVRRRPDASRAAVLAGAPSVS